MTAATYGWIITKDHISNGEDKNVVGPFRISTHIVDRLQKGEGQHFKMYDDDDILYYEGLLIVGHDGEARETMFEPLDDFGMPNAGCTRIDYKNPLTNNWSTL